MDLSLYKTTIQQASLSYLTARLLTIFLKRNFSFQVQARNDVLQVLPVVIALFLAQFEFVSPVLSLLALLCSNLLHFHDEMVKTFCVWISIHVAVYANFSESSFACLALAFATTQFLRQPDKLKNLMREPRVICGPVYVILVCAGLRFCSASHFYETLLTVMASIFSVMAAVLFRPDNNVTLKLILPETKIPTTYVRQVIHGSLLFVGFLATFAKSAMLRSESMLNFEIGVAFVLLNTGLFVNYKKTRGWR